LPRNQICLRWEPNRLSIGGEREFERTAGFRRKGEQMRQLKPLFASLLTLAALSGVPSLSARDGQGKSQLTHARVVSLSLVQGTVLVRKPGSPKWARAKLDMALEEGMSIATAKNSFAEVQFENGSRLRIGEISRVDLTEMALAQRGDRVSHLNLAFGLATANLASGRHDEYVLNAADATIMPRGKSEFRIDLGRTRLRVEVFRGHVEAADSNQSEPLSKNQVLALDETAHGPFEVTNPIHTDQWDKWVRDRDEQVALAEYQDNAAMSAVLNDWSHVVPPPGLFGGGIVDDGF
jgi:ferric-dicitrate binding protein FerR (iron transport regulator)